MLDNTQVYVLVKPECSPYLDRLEKSLARNELTVQEIYSIPDWRPVAREIYKRRIATEGPEFHAGFEGHLWLSTFLFGEQAAILTLVHSGNDVTDVLETSDLAIRAKMQFRDTLPYTRDGSIFIAMNLEQIEALTLRNGAIRGRIGVERQSGTFEPFELTSQGLWDYFYLKYIHVPTPDWTEIYYEWGVLNAMNLLTAKHRISKPDWRLMQQSRSLTPPGVLEASK